MNRLRQDCSCRNGKAEDKVTAFQTDTTLSFHFYGKQAGERDDYRVNRLKANILWRGTIYVKWWEIKVYPPVFSKYFLGRL